MNLRSAPSLFAAALTFCALPALFAQAEPEPPEGYRIGPGDILQVSVWREPDASIDSAAVRFDGKITVPLVKEVHVTGLTPTELSGVLTRRLKEFINNPDVTVIVRDIRSQKVFVGGGGIAAQGAMNLATPMTVLQVIFEAGGLTEYAKRKKIYLLRKEGTETKRLDFDYDMVLVGKAPEQNIYVQPGDTIVVPD